MTAGRNILHGKHILVVEDEYLIASDLRRTLSRAGAVVVGPAGSLSEGLALARSEPLHAAILDIKLQGRSSEEIAAVLKKRSVPFCIHSGYDQWSLSPESQPVLRIAKPCTPQAFLTAVRRLVGSSDNVL